MAGEKQPKPEDVYGLTEQEQLFDRVDHERFQDIISDLETTIHQIQVSANNYGEFLFVTTSRAINDTRSRLTFWGLGYHEYRERWISKEWFWYQSYPHPEIDKQAIDKNEATELINHREQEITPHQSTTTQTERGKLFDILADFTDEDGAYSEIEEQGDLFDDLDNFSS